jgi:Zn-dependent M16 (insulinase) family peptidase
MFLGKILYVSESEHDRLFYVYPNVDVAQELRMMDDWLESNPRRRKKNYRRFISNWLKSEERKAVSRRVETRVGCGPSDSGIQIKLKQKARA